MNDATPLSGHERRTLREIERHLQADALLARSLMAEPSVPGRSRRPATATVTSGAATIVGVVLALVGVILTPRSIGVGVTVVVAGALVFVASVVLWFAAAAGRGHHGR